MWNLEPPDATALAANATFAQLAANGAWIVIAGEREVGVWETATARRRCTHAGHAAKVAAADVSRDGALAASGDAAGVIRIWSATTCALAREIRAHTGPVLAVALAPDALRLVTAGDDGVARLWDARTGALAGELPIGTPIKSVGFSPDGATLFVVPSGGYIAGAAANAGLLYDARTLVRVAVLAHRRPLARLELRADGRALTVSRDGTAAIWRRGVVETRLDAPAGAWFDAGFDPAGDHVVTCGQDPEALVWDARTGLRVGALSRHAGYVLSCAYSGDGRFIVTASSDGTARIWDAATLLPLETLTLSAAPDPMLWPAARFVPSGHQLLTSTRAGDVRLWQLAGPRGAELPTCRVPWRVANGVLVRAEGRGC